MMITVLLLSPLSPPNGGIASWTDSYLKWANHNEYSVSIVNTAVIGRKANNINSKSDIITEIKRFYKIRNELLKVLKMNKTFIAHINLSLSGYGILRDYILARTIKKRKIKVLVQFHCSVVDFNKRANCVQKYFFSKIENLSDTLVYLNRLDFEVFGSKKNRSFIVPNFVDVKKIIRERSIRDNITRVVFVGHVNKNKGITELLEAAKTLPQIVFDIAGPISGKFDGIARSSNAIFHGNLSRNNVIDLLYQADVFVLPSYSEGFSIALLEAMASGLPVIVSRAGANEEIVTDKSGIMLNHITPRDIVEAITNLQSKEKRVCMAKYNFEKAQKEFDLDKVLLRFVNIYEGM